MTPRARRRRRTRKGSASLRLGFLLCGLTAVNVYVFYFKSDTSVHNLLEASAIASKLPGENSQVGTGNGDDQVLGPAGAESTDPGTGGSRIVEGEIGKLDTLSTLLTREGFGSVAMTVPAALGELIDPRTIKPGEKYTLTFDEEGAPASFEYRPNAVDTYVVARKDDGSWRAEKAARDLEVRVETAAATIDTSLYGSVQAAGEAPALVSLMVDLFAWDINFYIDTHPGDHWKIVIEKQYLDGAFYRYGRLLAAEYGGRVGAFRAFYWKDGAQEGYFDEKGQSVAKTFLKSPLRFVRISSKFDHKRLHPVLHRTKAHLGVDFAAPPGTPVWAAASGKVVEARMKRGSGNTVVIRHNNGYGTRYYHLQKFARGLSEGQYVKQKQIIGYVGTTGLSTGPHLHFGLTQNGAFVDPLKVKGMRDRPVGRRAAYLSTIAQAKTQMDGVQPAKLATAPASPATTASP